MMQNQNKTVEKKKNILEEKEDCGTMLLHCPLSKKSGNFKKNI